MLNLSHSEEDLADRSSDLVEGKSQDFENKKIRRLGRNKLLRPCAASFHRVDVNSDPPKRLFLSIMDLCFVSMEGGPVRPIQQIPSE